MNINDLISNEEIKKQSEKKSNTSEIFSNFWQVPEGKSTIRLLPRLDSKIPWEEVISHRDDETGIYGTCLKTYKGDKGKCPICTRTWEMHNSGIQQEKEAGYAMRPKTRYIFNCYIVNDGKDPSNNGTVKLISVGVKLFNKIKEDYEAEDLGISIFDPENGFDFVINKTIDGKYPDYSSSRFMLKRYKIESLDALKDKLINIKSIITEDTAETLIQKFGYFLQPDKYPKPQKNSYQIVEPKNVPSSISNNSPSISNVSSNIKIDDDDNALLDDVINDLIK